MTSLPSVGLTLAEQCRERILGIAGQSADSVALESVDTRAVLRLLENVSGAYHGLSLFEALRYEIKRIIARLGAIEQSKLNIAIIGEFSSGKSSLVNALVGGETLLPVSISETTALVSRLEYATYPSITIHYRDGRKEVCGIDTYQSLVDESQHSAIRRHVDVVSVCLDYKPLKKVTIYDTPGLNSKIADHERTTLEYINSVEVVFWMFRATKPMSGTELQYIDVVRSRGCKVYGIINGIDKITGFETKPELWQKELDRVMRAFNERCGGFTEMLVPISAKLGMIGMKNKDAEIISKSNIKTIHDIIDGELTSKAEMLKRDYLGRMIGLFGGLGNATRQYLNEVFGEARSALTNIQEMVAHREKEMEAERVTAKPASPRRERVSPWDAL